MANADLPTKARQSYIDDQFDTAVFIYTQAISFDPHNPILFAERAQAHMKLCHFSEAIADADRAIESDPSMFTAYMRKGAAFFKLKDYGAAKAAFEIGSRFAPTDIRFADWITKCDKSMDECGVGRGDGDSSSVMGDKSVVVVEPSRLVGVARRRMEDSDKLVHFQNFFIENLLRELNTLERDQLEKMKGVGKHRAEKIIELRKQSEEKRQPPPFQALNDLEKLFLSTKQAHGWIEDVVKASFHDFLISRSS